MNALDRSASYYARYAAKNIVATCLADKCEVQVAYAIGVPEPLAINLDCFGTEKVSIEKLRKAFNQVFDFKPSSIIKELDLKRPIYKKTAVYGHFGRDDPDFTWERTDKTDALKEALAKIEE